MRHRRPEIPDPDENPTAYKDADVLEDLFVTRGWRRRDIADYFGITDSEVRRALRVNDVERETKGSSAPNNGLARQIWEHGRQEAMK